MCGRFTIRTAPNAVAMMFDVTGGLDSVADVRLRYNVTPTTPVLCIRQSEVSLGLRPHVTTKSS